MTNVKQYLDIDCFQAAKDRINNIIDTFDNVFVAFSGGKDSLALLHMTQIVYNERGIKDKIKVIFRDEEVIPDDVIAFVQDHYNSGLYEFYYFCIPLKSEKFILGTKYGYVQWDKNRKHLREVPTFAITDWDNVYNQYTADERTTRGFSGKKCIMTGIRSSESIIRFRAVMNKQNMPWITATENHDVCLGKPIYDWEEIDVFKFFYEHGITYCDIYDAQLFNGDRLRVSTPLHAENAKKLFKLKTLYPKFYDQLLELFPEIDVQARYYRDMDFSTDIYYKYPRTWMGILQYIDDTIKEKNFNMLAKKRVSAAIKTRINKEKQGKLGINYGGYPKLHVFKKIVTGQYKREIMPCPKPTPEEMAYEQP